MPSPSALVVLLAAIALGRTVFGAGLVVAYGLGMATTLTVAGLALVRVRDRWSARAQHRGGRLASGAARLSAAMPFVTSTVVIVVGVGLAVRSLAG